MTEELSDKERLEKQQDIAFCLTLLGEQAERLKLPEVHALSEAAGLATTEIDCRVNQAANENSETMSSKT